MTADCNLAAAGCVERVAQTILHDRVPVSGSFDLTYRCNFRCSHCYAGHLVAQTPRDASELDTGAVLSLLTEAADAGCLFLLLSGGEPLLRPDFVPIYLGARRLGMVVTVFTNASLLKPSHLAAFAEARPHRVEVSLYGATPATYERVTGVPGSYDRVRRGVDLLLEAGQTVGLKAMVLQSNLDEIPAIEALADSLGVEFRLDPLVTPRLDGDTWPLRERVSPVTAAELEFSAATPGSAGRGAALREFLATHRPMQPADGDSSGYGCGAGSISFHMDPQGIMRPCAISREPALDAGALGFGASWSRLHQTMDAFTWGLGGVCADCPDSLLCSYCPGLLELEHASPANPPEYLCELTRNRRLAVAHER